MLTSRRAAGVAALVLATVARAQYCVGTHSQVACGSSEFITNVTIGSMNNTSSCAGGPGVEDFTGLPGPLLARSVPYPIAVTVSTFQTGDNVSAFCDWNGDLDWDDAGEAFALVPGSGAGTVTFQGVITAPSDASSSAPTQMRVRLVRGIAPAPCGAAMFGELEDYMITVVPENDDCALAIPLALGANGPFSNVGATDSGASASCGWAGTPGYRDLWFTFTPSCSGPYRLDTDSPPNYDVNLAVFDSCGGNEIACSEDDGVNWFGAAYIPALPLTAGWTYVLRVGAALSWQTGSFQLNVNPIPPAVTWSSPLGPGSIRWDLERGFAFGTYLHAITVAPGAYPGGWFFGLDIPISELVAEMLAGFPFVGPLDACGNHTLGPIVGLPSGLPIYSVAVLMTGPGLAPPALVTPAVAYVVP